MGKKKDKIKKAKWLLERIDELEYNIKQEIKVSNKRLYENLTDTLEKDLDNKLDVLQLYESNFKGLNKISKLKRFIKNHIWKICFVTFIVLNQALEWGFDINLIASLIT